MIKEIRLKAYGNDEFGRMTMDIESIEVMNRAGEWYRIRLEEDGRAVIALLQRATAGEHS